MPRKDEPEFMRLGQAAERLGVHRNVVARLIKEGQLAAAGPDPLDRRAVLVKRADVERLARMVDRPQKQTA